MNIEHQLDATLVNLVPLTETKSYQNVLDSTSNVSRIYTYLKSRLERGQYIRSPESDHSRFNRAIALLLWVKYHKEWNVVVRSMTGSDMLFMCICLHHVLTNPDKFVNAQEQIDRAEGGICVQRVFDELRRIAFEARRRTITKPEQDVLFNMCCVVIVFGFMRADCDSAPFDLPTLIARGFQVRRNPFYNIQKQFEDESSSSDANSKKAETPEQRKARIDKEIRQRVRAIEVGEDGLQGESEEEKRMDEEEEMQIHKDAGIAALQEGFIPWCARVFFHLWFEETVIFEPCRFKQEDELAQLRVEYATWGWDNAANRKRWRANFERWIGGFARLQAIDRFKIPFREFCCSTQVAIGGNWFSTRAAPNARETRTSAEIFHQESESEAMSQRVQEAIDTDIREIWHGKAAAAAMISGQPMSNNNNVGSDEKGVQPMDTSSDETSRPTDGKDASTNSSSEKEHPFRQQFAFYQFCYLMKSQLKIEFSETYVKLEPQLLESQDWKQEPTLYGHRRRPQIRQVLGRYWVKDNNRFHEVQDSIESLILWMLIVWKSFDCTLECGRKIRNEKCDWISIIFV